jgi:RimJ/RimL family protein N-acetyltransferase
MTPDYKTAVPPDLPQVITWLDRLRQQQGLDAARQTCLNLVRRHPDQPLLAELLQWHQVDWWRPLSLGSIRLERRCPDHFDFVWSLVLNTDFSQKLKYIPPGLTPRDLLDILTRDQFALLPQSRSMQWVVFHGDIPVGLSMLVGINFRNRSAEQIMGILPGYDHSFVVADAYSASLSFAFNSLGLNKVQGLVYGSNQEVAVQQERLGFVREGVSRSAVWSEENQNYEDLVQIALLQSEFDQSRVLQRLIRRQPSDPFLLTRRSWSRQPLKVTQV